MKANPPRNFTGAHGAYPDDAQIDRWLDGETFVGYRDEHDNPVRCTAGNIGIRMPDDVIGLDVDAQYGNKRGDQTLAEHEAKLGKLPATYISTSRPGTPSGIRFYRVPPGTRLRGQIRPDIEIIQRHHRYAVVWPSIHPEGRPYLLIDPDGNITTTPPRKEELPFLPAAWIEYLSVDEPGAVAAGASTTVDRPLVERSDAVARALADAISNLAGGRHDGATAGAMALARLEAQGHPGAGGALDTLRGVFLRDVTADGSRTEREAEGEWHRIAASARTTAATTPATTPTYDEIVAEREAAAAERRAAEADVRQATDEIAAVFEPSVATEPSTHLPDEFWHARPCLSHIRQAAQARLVGADAVLGAALARVAAITPHTVELAPSIASPVGLTFYAALVGGPEAGKSGATNVAAELVPAPATVLDRLPIGSGEGMTEILFEYVDEEDDKGKVRQVKRQTRNAAIFHIDEGSVLGELSQRKGTTLLANLRTAYTHGKIGQTNAKVENRRIIDGTDYVYGITMGIQPELAGPLLDDAPAGTPQRFVWFAATDPAATADVVDWPGELPWTPPRGDALDEIATHRALSLRHQIGIPPGVERELRERRVAVANGSVVVDQADAHMMLVRLKIAALLAILDGRVHIDTDDWQLAEIIDTTSRTVRRWIGTTLSAVAARDEAARTARVIRRELITDRAKATDALVRVARKLAKYVHNNGDEGCLRGDLNRRLAGRDREVVTLGEAIDEAERMDWIVARDDRWFPGGSAPA
jgi:hypothetical protein